MPGRRASPRHVHRSALAHRALALQHLAPGIVTGARRPHRYPLRLTHNPIQLAPHALEAGVPAVGLHATPLVIARFRKHYPIPKWVRKTLGAWSTRGRLSGSGQMRVRSGHTHFPVRSVSHRPDSGIRPVAAVHQQLDATAPRVTGRIIAPRFVRMCSTSPCGPGNAGFRTSPHAASCRGRISATRRPRLTESGAASRDHGNVLPSLGAFQVAVIRQLRQATRVLGQRGAAGFHQARKHEPQQGGADVHLILRWPNLGQSAGQPQDRPPRVGAFRCPRGGDPFHTQTPGERVA